MILGSPVFLRVTLKNWEEPRDEAILLPCQLVSVCIVLVQMPRAASKMRDNMFAAIANMYMECNHHNCCVSNKVTQYGRGSMLPWVEFACMH